jgi:uncharacterized membrane protein YbhN (UPF0104 family)
MSATTAAAGSGAVLGAVLVFLIQQLGYLSLSDLIPAVVLLLVAMVVLGIIGGGIGWYLDRHH